MRIFGPTLLPFSLSLQLLYSNQSEGCQISEEYINDFEKPLDVFTTHNKNDAIVIEDQFEQHCDPFVTNPHARLASFSLRPLSSRS